jgi:hypothetical protein
MHPTGHSAAQAPHATQESVIFLGIINSSHHVNSILAQYFYFFNKIFYFSHDITS